MRREAEIQRAILELLRVLAIPAWRQNSGAFVLNVGQGKPRFFRAGVKGNSDILACLPPSGKLLALEVKRPGNKLTLEQDAFLTAIAHAGGIGAMVTSPKDVMELLARHGWEAR